MIVEEVTLHTQYNSNWGAIGRKDGYSIASLRSVERVSNGVYITEGFGKKVGTYTFFLNNNLDSSIDIPAIIIWAKI